MDVMSKNLILILTLVLLSNFTAMANYNDKINPNILVLKMEIEGLNINYELTETVKRFSMALEDGLKGAGYKILSRAGSIHSSLHYDQVVPVSDFGVIGTNYLIYGSFRLTNQNYLEMKVNIFNIDTEIIEAEFIGGIPFDFYSEEAELLFYTAIFQIIDWFINNAPTDQINTEEIDKFKSVVLPQISKMPFDNNIIQSDFNNISQTYSSSIVEEEYLDPLFLSFANCSKINSIGINNDTINICNSKGILPTDQVNANELLVYTPYMDCPVGFTKIPGLEIAVSNKTEHSIYIACRPLSSTEYNYLFKLNTLSEIPILHFFDSTSCPFGSNEIWLEPYNNYSNVVGCISRKFIEGAIELRQAVDILEKANDELNQNSSTDTQIPLITITRADTADKQGIVAGRVSDNVGVAEVIVDGNVVLFSSNGSFEYSTYVSAAGKTIQIQVTDLSGLSSSQTVTLKRDVNLATASISFDELNPIAKPAMSNNNALALIIGVSDYENTPAKAIYADTDAMVFHDYASEKLGIPDNRIKTLVNDGADEREMLLAVQSWLSRSVKQDQTDVYVFFAGHGLASDDGEQMYLLPYDGSPELLDKTAILRDELFTDIANTNPRSVTVFLDTCYSGSNRGSEMLIADARPILLKAKDTSVPEGFTVFTAAAGDEIAKSLEEAKHGMFSYFLMKGMEGDADANGDKQITAGELHAYVKSNVVQQSSGTQTPELQGDADRVLVRFR